MVAVTLLFFVVCLALLFALRRSFIEHDKLARLLAKQRDDHVAELNRQYIRGCEAGEESGLKKAQAVASRRHEFLDWQKGKVRSNKTLSLDARATAFAYWQARHTEAGFIVNALRPRRVKECSGPIPEPEEEGE